MALIELWNNRPKVSDDSAILDFMEINYEHRNSGGKTLREFVAGQIRESALTKEKK